MKTPTRVPARAAFWLAAFLVSTLLSPLATFGQGTTFTYQGFLTVQGGPVNGSNDLTFTLFDAATLGNTVGASNVVNDLAITNGLFTVSLNFGANFNGAARWLQIAARPGNSTGAYTNVSPRQSITPMPYAIFAGGASATGVTGTLPSSALSGTYSGAVNFSNASNTFAGNASAMTNLNPTNLVGIVADARLSTNVAFRSGGNTFSGNQRFLTNVGIGTVPVAQLDVRGPSSVVGGIALGDYNITNSRYIGIIGPGAPANIAAGSGFSGVEFGGPAGNTNSGLLAFHTHNFGGGSSEKMRISKTGNVGIGTTMPNAPLSLGSSLANTKLALYDDGGLFYGLGVQNNQFRFHTSTASDRFSFLNGPNGNETLTIFGTGNVGIGNTNPVARLHVGSGGAGGFPLASSLFRAEGGSLGGSVGNSLTLGSFGYTPAGGNDVTLAVKAVKASTNAGWFGTAVGLSMDVDVTPSAGGGLWFNGGGIGIGTTTPSAPLSLGSSLANTKLALYDDGNFFYGLGVQNQQFRFHTASASARFSFLNAPNGTETFTIFGNGNVTAVGEVTCVAVNLTSDRNAKEAFKPINPREVLAKVAALPISEWQYKGQGEKPSDGTRHIGPMAQDFRAAFGTGRDDKHITSVDADGVALAAIQGLNEKLQEKSAEVEALKQSVAELKELVKRLAQPAGR